MKTILAHVLSLAIGFSALPVAMAVETTAAHISTESQMAALVLANSKVETYLGVIGLRDPVSEKNIRSFLAKAGVDAQSGVGPMTYNHGVITIGGGGKSAFKFNLAKREVTDGNVVWRAKSGVSAEQNYISFLEAFLNVKKSSAFNFGLGRAYADDSYDAILNLTKSMNTTLKHALIAGGVAFVGGLTFVAGAGVAAGIGAVATVGGLAYIAYVSATANGVVDKGLDKAHLFTCSDENVLQLNLGNKVIPFAEAQKLLDRLPNEIKADYPLAFKSGSSYCDNSGDLIELNKSVMEFFGKSGQNVRDAAVGASATGGGPTAK